MLYNIGYNMEYHVYTITHKSDPNAGVYVGSTSNFSLRRNNHKCFWRKKRFYNPIYKVIDEYGGWEQFEMKTIKICSTREEALDYENKIIATYDRILNNRKARVDDYPEYNRANARQYYKKNRDVVLAKAKEKRELKKMSVDNIDDNQDRTQSVEAETI
jgi:hypothetical protein